MTTPPAGPRRALRAAPQAPAGTLKPEDLEHEDEGGGSVLACLRCRQPVTTTAARIEVSGGHEHSFTNPHGIRFHIGCFARVMGCLPVGEPSTYWTWFPPYSWQVEVCGSCLEHLGWVFRSGSDAFHGLILDRLVEIEESP